MRAKTCRELTEEFSELSASQQRAVMTFVHFLRVKDLIDPSQAYFWTRQWQRWESEADRAKARGKLIGNGTVKGLLKALKAKS
jgi:hypothetical protein